jgi:DNA-directed RNA polymerase specialized sigma24 family protein
MVYFTQDTEDAIIKYNNEHDPIIKNKIYERKIHYPFFKLTENIVHTFKFYYTEVENIEDLQHEVITFLLSKIHLFDPSKGTKAYSYFGTIAKRYLILSNQKNYKKRLDIIPIEELYEDENYSYELEENYTNNKISEFMDLYVDFCTKNIFKIFPKEADARVADAILELFRKRDHLTIFNKKALYIYIREQIDVKTPKITKVANHLYKLYKSHYLFYEENGYMKV